MSVFQRYGIPGPKPHFITGNLMEYHKKRDKCLNEWIEKYGNIFGFFLGGKPCIVCRDLELLKLIQIKEFKTFANRDMILPDIGIPHHLICKAISLQLDDKWKSTRSILSKGFSSAKLKMISTLMSKPINIFLENVGEQLQAFDVDKFYKKLTFDITCRTAFGIQTNVQNEETNKFIQSVHKLLEADIVDFSSILSIYFPEFEPIPMYFRRILDVVKYMFNYPSAKMIFDTCRQMVVSRKISDYHPPDFLQIMIDAEDEENNVTKKLSINNIIANAVLFMAAGYDTTSTTLSWCTYYLCKYLEIQEAVRLEISKNVEDNREIEYTDLSELKYLDQVISETLRFYPHSDTSLTRICSEDFQYKNTTIPKGVTIVIPVRNLHKDSNYWNEPEKFNPDRFLSKNAGLIDPSIYQPFGIGPRNCIGMRTAEIVMKLILANLIRRYKLELYENSEIQEDFSIFILRPKNGIMIKATAITS
ncbi:cytochrome P450 3A31-like [Centruroides vittatus]|uniref:cytochrome P450 3A31-like n=1 Tax=Centruroides vittatus TaxID=120091 RepID=UPI0035100FE8